MSGRVILVSAVAGPLFERAAAEGRRVAPGAEPLALLHWRVAGAVPAKMPRWLATDDRDRPDVLLRRLRDLAPVATVVVCDGEPGATRLKLLGLLAGGKRIVVREDGGAYRLPHDVLDLAAHLAARAWPFARWTVTMLGVVLSFPALLLGAWRWRRRWRPARWHR